MRASLPCLLAVVLSGLGNAAWAQFGRPIIIPRTPTVVPHVMPHGSGGAGSSSDSDWVFPVLALVGLVGFIGFLVVRHRRSASIVHVRIVAVPPGEAPEEVRRAWVGLELPLAVGETGPRDGWTYGVLSAAPAGVRNGCAVDGRIAVTLLAETDPSAADWWRSNAPHVLAGGYQLVFPAEVCEPVES